MSTNSSTVASLKFQFCGTCRRFDRTIYMEGCQSCIVVVLFKDLRRVAASVTYRLMYRLYLARQAKVAFYVEMDAVMLLSMKLDASFCVANCL
ncbi:uncharacterized protein LOC110941067 isoform X3 [Helianthus annuus]|uniref:uncharacterized protein LOC110941067 isoform X3 n=1 Tax=Helianthus annuus TaxID=4232 RepID=UPI000B908C17|nr:uncharacterized protein LOC110941067 isoform X3 [Helianthus annuus]